MNQNDANFPIFEEGKLRPPNKCHVTLIRAQRPLLEGTAVQTMDYFQNGEFPSSHHREEGWPSDQENIAQHPLFARTGWCSDRWDKEHHPGGVHKEASHHFLMTPPPLLAVMRGGEFALFKMRPPTTYCCLGRAGRSSQRLLQP